MDHRETSSPSSSLPATLPQRFGATVRHYRKQRGLTQRALAARMGLHYRYISKIELGQRTIGVLLLSRLAHALDIPASCLLAPLETSTSVDSRGETPSVMTPSTQPSSSSPLLQRLGATIRQTRQDQQLAQPTVAAASGLSVGYISEIELGQRNLTVVSLVRIAHALGVPVAQLLKPLEPFQSLGSSPPP